ncbi:MAG: hypothetical protein AAF438_13070 [Pseudomonadota bacterium]
METVKTLLLLGTCCLSLGVASGVELSYDGQPLQRVEIPEGSAIPVVFDFSSFPQAIARNFYIDELEFQSSVTAQVGRTLGATTDTLDLSRFRPGEYTLRANVSDGIQSMSVVRPLNIVSIGEPATFRYVGRCNSGCGRFGGKDGGDFVAVLNMNAAAANAGRGLTQNISDFRMFFGSRGEAVRFSKGRHVTKSVSLGADGLPFRVSGRGTNQQNLNLVISSGSWQVNQCLRTPVNPNRSGCSGPLPVLSSGVGQWSRVPLRYRSGSAPSIFLSETGYQLGVGSQMVTTARFPDLGSISSPVIDVDGVTVSLPGDNGARCVQEGVACFDVRSEDALAVVGDNAVVIAPSSGIGAYSLSVNVRIQTGSPILWEALVQDLAGAVSRHQFRLGGGESQYVGAASNVGIRLIQIRTLEVENFGGLVLTGLTQGETIPKFE